MLLSKVSGINAKDFGDELAADWEEDDRAEEREREADPQPSGEALKRTTRLSRDNRSVRPFPPEETI